MKNRKYLLASAFLIMIASLAWLLSPHRDRNHASQSKLDLIPASFRSATKPENHGADHGRKTRIQNGKCVDPRVERGFKEDHYTIELSSLSSYLALHHRSPQSLAAAFLLTEDASILAELRQHLDDPQAVLGVAQAQISGEERASLIKRYVELNPNEMIGYMLAASLVVGQGNEKEQLELIMKGMSAESFSGGFGSVNADLAEALSSSGMTTTEIQIYLVSNANFSGRLFRTGIEMVTRGCQLAVSAATTPEEKTSAAEKFLSVSESFRELAPYSFENGEGFYLNSVSKILKQLPDERVLADYGCSVLEYRKKISAEIAENARSRMDATGILMNLPPDLVDLYFEKRLTNGYKEANRWLIESQK